MSKSTRIDNAKKQRPFLRKLRQRLDSKKIKRGRRVTRRIDNARSQGRVNYFTKLNLLVFLGFLGISSIIALLYTFTAGVYVDAFRDMSADKTIIVMRLGSETAKDWFVIGPLLGWLLGGLEGFINAFETSAAGLMGLGFFFVVQTLEVLPTIIWESPALILHLIDRLENKFDKSKISKQDSDTVKRLKERHNNYYANMIDALDDLRTIAFVIDSVVCFFLIKFVYVGYESDGTWILGRFFEGVTQYDFGLHKFAPMPTIKVISSLFLILLLVKLGMKVFNGFQLFAKKEEVAKDV